MRDDAGPNARAQRQPRVNKRSFGMFHVESRRLKAVFDRITAVVPVKACKGEPPQGLRSIFLCMTPRSGSTYLGSALEMNKVGRFGEYFRVVGRSLEQAVEADDAKTYEEYVRGRIAALSVNGVFGAKVDWMQFAPLYHFGAYERYFRDASYVYLTRNDVIAQAVSRYIGSETGYFHSVHKHLEDTRNDEVPFDFDVLWRHVEHLIDMQSAWEYFFASEGISPLRLSYEEIDDDPKAVLRRISDFVGVPLPDPIVIDTDYKKVRNERNDRLKALVIEEARRRRLAVTPEKAVEIAAASGPGRPQA